MIAVIVVLHFAQPCTLSCMSVNADQHRVRVTVVPTWGPRK